ncbi:META domain-containing protein [Brachyspira sp.]|uniref:META domain-containing protein n=1 Tax=Brachyspira sp. TaxID=1977261 RepID=UPI002639B343|nr:META domain-containing protein [Brachyspira sp.]
MKKLLSTILMIMGTIFVLSCGGNTEETTPAGDTNTTEPATITEVPLAAITVEDLVGKEFTLTNMYEGKEVTIAFTATNMIGGNSAINNYFTEFSLDGDKIAFKALGSTKMAGPEEDMAVETEYLQILSGANTVSLDEDVLTITTTSGTNLIYTFKGNVEVVSDDTNQ